MKAVYELNPGHSIGPFKLGLDRIAIIHIAKQERIIFDKPLSDQLIDDFSAENGMGIRFKNGVLDHIGVASHNITLLLDGVSVFEADSFLVLQLLARRSKQAFECFGMIIFDDLGIGLGGFHDGDESQKAIFINPPGAITDLNVEMTPLPPNALG